MFGILAIFYYFICFFLTGFLFPEKIHKNSLGSILLLGFVAYYAVFQCIALPMKLLKLPLKYLTISWLAVIFLLAVVVCVRKYKCMPAVIKNLFSSKKNKVVNGTMIGIATAIGCLLALNIDHISDWDASYYIGLPVSSVFSNTIELCDPYTGKALDSFNHYYLLNTDTIHNAVIYQAFNVHPIVHAKLTLTFTFAFLFVILLYKIGDLLFSKEKKRAEASIMFTCFSLLILFFSYSIAGVSHYFAYRTYEGKSITSYFYMTLIFYFFLSIYFNERKTYGYIGIFFCALGGICFCNTALFVIPIAISCMLLPYALYQKSIKALWSYAIVVSPCLFWIILHSIL